MTVSQFQLAISFLDRHDRDLAERLDGLLSAALPGPIFVYWRHQALIAGKDETQAFGPIFENPTTVDVVIYRPDWGTAGATLAEAQAIKRRHFAGDRNFLFVIGPTRGLTLPNWMPPGFIYFDASQYPLQEAVEGIAALVRLRSSGQGDAPDLLQRVQARERANRDAEAQARFARSDEALRIAREQAKSLFIKLIGRASEVASAGQLRLHRMRMNRDQSAALVANGRDTVVLYWEAPQPDSPAGSIWFSELDGPVQLPHDDAKPVRPGRELVGAELQPEFTSATLVGWRVVKNPKWNRSRYADRFDNNGLIEFVLQRVFER